MEHLKKNDLPAERRDREYARSALPKLRSDGRKKGGGEIGDLFIRVAERMEGQRGETILRHLAGGDPISFPKPSVFQRGQAGLKDGRASWISWTLEMQETVPPLSGATGSNIRVILRNTNRNRPSLYQPWYYGRHLPDYDVLIHRTAEACIRPAVG